MKKHTKCFSCTHEAEKDFGPAGDYYPCHVCWYSYSDRWELKEEMKKDHPEILNKAKEQIFVCMMCGKENKGITFCDHILEEEE